MRQPYRSSVTAAPARLRRGRLTLGLSGAAAVLAAIAIVTLPARAGTGTPIVSAASGKCLDVAGAARTPGTAVITYSCRASANQLWEFTAAGELRSLGGDVCLDDFRRSTTPGINVISYPCNGGANQRWTRHADGSIRSVHAGLCLDTATTPSVDRTVVNLQTCTGAARQRWTWGAPAGATASASIPAPPAAAPSASTTPTATGAGAGAAFAHPGIGFDLADLARLKANLGTEPWKSAYASFLKDQLSSPTYQMRGPFTKVSRNPDEHLSEYGSDMRAAYQLTLIGYLSGDPAYSARARDIVTAWCTTQTMFWGAESSFAIADYGTLGMAAADVLRSSYPGWTGADTRQCQKMFNDVYWPAVGIGVAGQGAGTKTLSAGQGAIQIHDAIAIAIFNDDRVKFDEAVNAYLTDPVGGIRDSLPNGELGDTGRDQPHAYGQLFHLAAAAEAAWKQGVDLYSAENDRLLAAAEYFSEYNLGGNPNFVPFGTGYGLYATIGGPRYQPWPDGLELIYNAYVVRGGLSAPNTTALRAKLSCSWIPTLLYRRTGGTATTAVRPAPAWTPPPATTATNLTSADIGTVRGPGSTTEAGGTWTVVTKGADAETGYRYAYQALTGDATITARVADIGSGGATGLMLRTALDARYATPYVFIRMYAGGAQVYWSANGKGVNWGGWQNFDTMAAPYWMRLVRRGDFVYGYSSSDGEHWSPAANVVYPNLPDTVYLGLAATTGTAVASNTATFDHVAIGAAGNSHAPAPTGVTVTADPAGPLVHWSATPNAVYYNVLRASTADGPYTLIASEVAGTSYQDTTAGSTRSVYAVQAASYGGLGPNSGPASASG